MGQHEAFDCVGKLPRRHLRFLQYRTIRVRIGLSLDEVGVELAMLPQNRVPERADWAKLSGSWTKRVDARIAELERLRSSLAPCIGCGCLSLHQCKLANPGDRAGRLGPGPRYWMG